MISNSRSTVNRREKFQEVVNIVYYEHPRAAEYRMWVRLVLHMRSCYLSVKILRAFLAMFSLACLLRL